MGKRRKRKKENTRRKGKREKNITNKAIKIR